MTDQHPNHSRGGAGHGVSVGAGLQEARLNTDLIDFLRKYCSIALYAIVVVAGLYFATNWFKQREARALDAAFLALNRAVESSSADALLAVANEHKGKAAVAELATLRAALVIFEDARMGVRAGTPVDQRQFPSEENRLTEQQIQAEYARAEELFRSVAQKVGNAKDRYLVAQQARWGLATALAAQGKFDQAKQAMTEYAQAAKRNGWAAQESFALNRLAILEEATRYSTLPALAELPASNVAPDPATLPVAPSTTAQPQPSGGMPIPDFTPQNASVTPVTDPELLERLNELRRQQQQGGNPALPPAPAQP
jgi:hypothetical protein